MSGLFYTFNIAKRGMAAQQTSLHVISHNVSNSNTIGFSKQRAVHSTTNPFPMPSLNSRVGAGQLGTGVDVSNITRARDEYTDNAIRRQTSKLLTSSARSQFLDSIEAIVAEPGDTGLSGSLTKFWSAWDGLSRNPENAESRKLVISNATALADSFRQTYTQLEELEKDLAGLQKDQIFEVNSLLKQIAGLNEQIKQVSLNNQTPNDLMDRRDVLLDTLSEKINFKVEKGPYNNINIVTTGTNGKDVYLLTESRVVNGVSCIDDVSFNTGKGDIDKSSFPVNIKADLITGTDASGKQNSITMTFKVFIDGDVNKAIDKEVKIDEHNIKDYFNVSYDDKGNVQIDSIKSSSLIYSKGTKSEQDAIDNAEPFDFRQGAIKGLDDEKKEISDYKNQLNDICRTIGIAVNTIHSDGKYDATAVEGDDAYKYDYFFDDIEGFDHPAKHLKVSDRIVKNPSEINAGASIDDPKAGDNARAKRILEIRNMRLDVANIKSQDDFVKGIFADGYAPGNADSNLATDEIKQSNSGDTLQTYYTGMIGQLGVSAQEAQRVVDSQENLLLQLSIQKQSVSGVSVDDEMIDMLQFQRAYQANAKMINVVDELLDLVVNRLVR